MAFSDYSLTPSANTTIGGVSVAENCASANINNALRQLAADGKGLANTVAAIPVGVPAVGGNVGPLIYTGRGAYRSNHDPSLVNGDDYHLLEGTALPTPAEGMRVWFYS